MCMHVCVYECVHAYLNVCASVYVYMSVDMNVYKCVYVHLCMNVALCVYEFESCNSVKTVKNNLLLVAIMSIPIAISLFLPY